MELIKRMTVLGCAGVLCLASVGCGTMGPKAEKAEPTPEMPKQNGAIERGVDRAVDRVEDRVNKHIDRAVDRQIDRQVDRVIHKTVDRAMSNVLDDYFSRR
ncbi:MAG: hypothetical protein AAGI68_04220 [Planctomycetota bacterium]